MRHLYFSLLLLSSSLLSCTDSEQRFDKDKWQKDASSSINHRERMVKDLMENYLKDGLSQNYVVNLLGEPEHIDNSEGRTLWYELRKDTSENGEPGKIKTLFISVDKDSIISNVRIEEWKFK